MTGKRIQRKHFLAAMGAAVVGVIGGDKLLSRDRSAKRSAELAAAGKFRPLPTDARAVARPDHT